MRRRGVLALLFAAACGAPAEVEPLPKPTGPRTAPAPRIVVAVVVDQLAAWIADERIEHLPKTGGFARLAREGTWVDELRYTHAITETAPGHSALFTGKPPLESGIVSNEVRGPDGKLGSVLRDPAARAVGPSGVRDAISSSIARLRVPTIADRVKDETPDRLVVALSLKDRGAIFAGGRRPDAALWFDVGGGSFVTSTAFADAYPAWAVSGLPAHVRDAMAGDWSDPAPPPPGLFADDAGPGEGDLGGYGVRFPHRFAAAKNPFEAMRASPVGDRLLVDLATDAVRFASESRRPLYLALSFSSHDYVGHVFGPTSLEAWDLLVQLDHQLGRLMSTLDAAVGADGWALVLAGDHGIPPAPEAPARGEPCPVDRAPTSHLPCTPRKRVSRAEVLRSLQGVAEKTLGPGAWIADIVDPYLFFAPAADALEPTRREALTTALVDAIEHAHGFYRAYDVRRLPDRCPANADESVDALVCRGVVRGEDGDLYLVPAPGTVFGLNYVDEAGAVHGTPWLHDRAVPFFVRAPGRVAAGARLRGPVGPVAYTRALAEMLGVTWDVPPGEPILGPKITSADAPSRR